MGVSIEQSPDGTWTVLHDGAVAASPRPICSRVGALSSRGSMIEPRRSVPFAFGIASSASPKLDPASTEPRNPRLHLSSIWLFRRQLSFRLYGNQVLPS